jgi:peptidyl-prolyl cis-trans isomerase-like 3
LQSKAELTPKGIIQSNPDSNQSQFFISYAPQPSLDLKYTTFGKVIDGFDALDALERVEVNAKFKPVKETKLRFVTIHANPIAEETHEN